MSKNNYTFESSKKSKRGFLSLHKYTKISTENNNNNNKVFYYTTQINEGDQKFDDIKVFHQKEPKIKMFK